MINPVMLDIALWYHCRPGDYGRGSGDNNYSAPAIQTALRLLTENDLLTLNHSRQGQTYAGTDALAVWIDAILRVPFPVQQWVVPLPPHPNLTITPSYGSR